jgi:hypothetical protein
MENLVLNPNGVFELPAKKENSNSKFMEANTVPVNLSEIRDKHIIPVFLKDNEPTISQVDFVEVVAESVKDKFNLPFTPECRIRVSHPIKGRVYEARHKKASELFDNEKTIYYERMAFLMKYLGSQQKWQGTGWN